MKILFFDGYCTLCNGLVDWFITADRDQHLQFASLQGEKAGELLKGSTQDLLDPDTVVYYRDGQIYERSTAVLKSLSDLNGIYKLSALFLVIPPFIRDAVYRMVAKNRYKIFGKKDTCRLPTELERDRILR